MVIIHEQIKTRHILKFKGFDFANMSLDERLEFAIAQGVEMPGLTPNEMLALQKGLDLLPSHPVIVETGLGAGTSTRFFYTHIAKHGGELHSIEKKVKAEIRNPLIQLGIWDKIHVHEEDTRLMSWPKGIGINCLFIDSEHAISNVLSEYMKFRWLLKGKAIIGFHDTAMCLAVRRAIEIIQEMDILELVANCERAGGGVRIYKLIARDLGR